MVFGQTLKLIMYLISLYFAANYLLVGGLVCTERSRRPDGARSGISVTVLRYYLEYESTSTQQQTQSQPFV